MHGSLIITVALAAVIVVFILVRQVVERPVTQRGLLLPPVLCAGLGALFLAGHPGPGGIAAAVAGLAIGGSTGLLGGRVVRVWRDAATGVVLQHGGWRYLVVLLALLLIRVLLRLAFARNGVVDAAALNVALIAALVGNLLGRDARIALRALPLAGGSFSGLSSR
jgi:membrane protein CcdC involved in cytochrome C biogenesis